jgi:hypothetical protein
MEKLRLHYVTVDAVAPEVKGVSDVQHTVLGRIVHLVMGGCEKVERTKVTMA